MRASSKQKVLKLAQLAILIALIFVMQYIGTLVSAPFAAMGIELSFVLIPIVVGAFLLGPIEGAVLGLVFGIMTVVLTVMSPGGMTYILMESNPIMYVIVATLKAIAAGLGSGLIYKGLDKAFKGKLVYLRTLLASASAPIINTGIFLIGCLIFFMDTVSAGALAEGMSVGGYLIVAFVGLNFVFELLVNVILSPAILRIINIKKKAH